MMKSVLLTLVVCVAICATSVFGVCELCSNSQSIAPAPNATIGPGNGCGSSLFNTYRVIPDFSFTNCCDVHDICYSTCGNGTSKASCDAALYQCSLATCPNQPNAFQRALCRIAAKCYAAALNQHFCIFYQETQRAACTCSSSSTASPAQNTTSNPDLPNLSDLRCPPSIDDIIDEEKNDNNPDTTANGTTSPSNTNGNGGASDANVLISGHHVVLTCVVTVMLAQLLLL